MDPNYMYQQQAGQQAAYGYSAPQANMEGQRSLYVGNLDPKVTEFMLSDIFSTIGPVVSVKIIPDKAITGGPNYGFVEMIDTMRADAALQSLNGRKIFGLEIRVNWAFASGSGVQKEDTSNHYHIFVGDLSPEVDDAALSKAFTVFGSMSDARVMWDIGSRKSRGYGFIAFREKADAEKAITTMNGEFLGARSIRVNWANHKGAAAQTKSGLENSLSYDQVVSQASPTNTTVYLGNLPPYTTQDHILPFFHIYGYVVEMRVQADRGFAFVKLSTHEQAAAAIVGLQGTPINGRPVKCSWGKDKPNELGYQPPSQSSNFQYQPYGGQAPAYGGAPNYSVPDSSNMNAAANPSGYDGYGYGYNQYYSAYGGYQGGYPNSGQNPNGGGQ
ncbi:RNA-binding domain-containing protein [Neoconidiobolus thromboides FSU 785]|nr:RNA-binding domain-containing protein [Neoconidiobolus thromboides FSU 785]